MAWIRSVKRNDRPRRAPIWYCVGRFKLFTGRNGTRLHVPAPLNEVVYNIVMPENCWPCTTTRGVTPCPVPIVATPENSHPFTACRAIEEPPMVGDHVQRITALCRWSSADRPLSAFGSLVELLFRTNP